MNCIIIIVCFILPLCSGRRVYLFDTINKDWNREEGNPGMKIRLTTKGLNHIRDSAIHVLNNIIPSVPIPNYSKRFVTAGAIPIETAMQMRNVQVVDFKPASHAVIKPLPPNQFQLALSNSDITFAGNFNSRISVNTLPIEGQGQFRAKASGVSLKANIALTVNGDGGISASISSCQSHIRYFQAQFQSGPPLNTLIQQYQTNINERLRREMSALMCNLMEKFTSGPGKSFLSRSAVKQPINFVEVDPLQLEKKPLLKFLDRVQKNLTLDNTLVRQPIATNEYMETWHHGHVFYDKGNYFYETPFSPKEMKEEAIETDRMLYIMGSEYILNSFLYQSYINNRLELKLTRDALPPLYADFLNTTCSDPDGDNLIAANPLALFSGICMGTLIPSLGSKYPNSNVQFKLVPQGIPDFKIANGTSHLGGSGRALIYIRDDGRDRQMAVAKVAAKSEVNLDVQDSRVYADMRITQLDTILHRSGLTGLHPVNVAQLGPLMKSVLEPPISNMFQRGAPIPFLDLFSLVNPTLKPKDGYIQLATDFKLNQNNLFKKIKDGLRNGL